MVKVEVGSPLASGTKITLNDTIEIWLSKKKYKEIQLTEKTSEGGNGYYFHYYALRCEISEASAQELIIVEDLDDLKTCKV